MRGLIGAAGALTVLLSLGLGPLMDGLGWTFGQALVVFFVGIGAGCVVCVAAVAGPEAAMRWPKFGRRGRLDRLERHQSALKSARRFADEHSRTLLDGQIEEIDVAIRCLRQEEEMRQVRNLSAETRKIVGREVGK